MHMRRLQSAFQLITAHHTAHACASQQQLRFIDHPRIPQQGILLRQRHKLALH